MKLQLKRPNDQFPPGGFGFIDPRTRRIFNGYEGTPAMHARNIRAHRLANPKLYPTEESKWFDEAEIVQEIYREKFKTAPHLFQGEPDNPPAAPTKTIQSNLGTCVCGSSDVTPIYCPTCGGQRITGYKCAACGVKR
jgi:hypothetical protein